MVRIEGKYTLEDFNEAHRLHFQQSKGKSVLTFSGNFLLFTIVLLLIGFVGAVFTKFPAEYYLLIPIGLVAGYAFFELYQRPRQIARIFEQQKELSVPFVMEISEEGFGFNNVYGNSLLPWNNFIKWKENDALFMLYRTDVMFNMVPKRMLAREDEQRAIRQILAQNIVPHPTPVSIHQPTGRVRRFVIGFLLFLAIVIMVYLNIRNMPR